MKKIFGLAEDMLGLSKDLVGFLFQLCHGSEEAYGNQKHIHLNTKLMLYKIDFVVSFRVQNYHCVGTQPRIMNDFV